MQPQSLEPALTVGGGNDIRLNEGAEVAVLLAVRPLEVIINICSRIVVRMGDGQNVSVGVRAIVWRVDVLGP